MLQKCLKLHKHFFEESHLDDGLELGLLLVHEIDEKRMEVVGEFVIEERTGLICANLYSLLSLFDEVEVYSLVLGFPQLEIVAARVYGHFPVVLPLYVQEDGRETDVSFPALTVVEYVHFGVPEVRVLFPPHLPIWDEVLLFSGKHVIFINYYNPQAYLYKNQVFSLQNASPILTSIILSPKYRLLTLFFFIIPEKSNNIFTILAKDKTPASYPRHALPVIPFFPPFFLIPILFVKVLTRSDFISLHKPNLSRPRHCG